MGLTDVLSGTTHKQNSGTPGPIASFIDGQLENLKPTLLPLYQNGIKKFQITVLDRLEDALDGDQKASEPFVDQPGIMDNITHGIQTTADYLNPVVQFRKNLPTLKKEFGEVLERKHAPVAQQFVDISVTQARQFLVEHINLTEIGTGIKGKVSGFFHKLTGHKKHEDHPAAVIDSGAGKTKAVVDEKNENVVIKDKPAERQAAPDETKDDGGMFGFNRIVSTTLDGGIENIKVRVKDQMHDVLYDVEENLYEDMPEGLQSIFDVIFGGNPFDSDLERERSEVDKDSNNPLVQFRRSMRLKLNKLLEEEHINLENQCIHEFKIAIRSQFGLATEE
ncbi:hypothetical protein HK099_007534 [Clydaea vesicula]|uniref:Uncharacterized protein n=1 Tax=Clydaea vesicula TaxID=447962 RepID=A0AAD5Y0J8_9FUNG|nr:hypothetical protein HK099_007534 [Clydaea vesicula]KAJ3394952.1 hypothetical protein HDU92_006417 [Lobulomyces angularis]